jgi:hypothetical protein
MPRVEGQEFVLQIINCIESFFDLISNCALLSRWCCDL